MKILLLLALVSCTYAAAFYNTGMCPDNKKAGDRWSHGTYICTECYCDDNGYGCTGCGLIAHQPGCIIKVDNTAPHPECCPKLTCSPDLSVG